jgi:hypothetical protein
MGRLNIDVENFYREGVYFDNPACHHPDSYLLSALCSTKVKYTILLVRTQKVDFRLNLRLNITSSSGGTANLTATSAEGRAVRLLLPLNPPHPPTHRSPLQGSTIIDLSTSICYRRLNFRPTMPATYHAIPSHNSYPLYAHPPSSQDAQQRKSPGSPTAHTAWLLSADSSTLYYSPLSLS